MFYFSLNAKVMSRLLETLIRSYVIMFLLEQFLYTTMLSVYLFSFP